MDRPAPANAARRLFEAPFVVVSHNAAADPILTYGNRAALPLWETNWESLPRCRPGLPPSRCAAMNVLGC